jgi:bifunctional DNA-binding transcriptional regulator/antitoxin component of YhaV-PrlF toxin-antitoxin module
VGYLCGKNMSTARVDQRHRIVIDKRTRAKTHIKAGDMIIIEPIDDHSFKVNVLDFTSEKLEDDSAWQVIHKPAKLRKYLPPEKLEIIEESIWQE